MKAQKDASTSDGTWGPPLLGLVGTVTAILVAFALNDRQHLWKSGLVAVVAGVVVVAIGLVFLEAMTGRHRQE